MEKYILLCFLILNSAFLIGQSFFTAGINYTTQSARHEFPFGGQKLENFKLTPSVGYGYNFKIKEKWSYQPILSLNDFGAINTPEKPKTIYYIYTASFDHFLDYRALPCLSFGISPSVYFVGYAGINGKSGRISNWEKIDGKVNRLVFSIVPRISFHVKENWSLNLSYRNDITSVGYALFSPQGYKPFWLKGYGLSIRLGYQLKSKKISG